LSDALSGIFTCQPAGKGPGSWLAPLARPGKRVDGQSLERQNESCWTLWPRQPTRFRVDLSPPVPPAVSCPRPRHFGRLLRRKRRRGWLAAPIQNRSGARVAFRKAFCRRDAGSGFRGRLTQSRPP